MKKLLYLLLVSALCACEPVDNTFYFVTTLGNDTLAIEQVKYKTNGLDAKVALRSPRLSLRQYAIEWDENNKMTRMDVSQFDQGFEETGYVIQNTNAEGDSLISVTEVRKEKVRRSILNNKEILPFIDMVHWPYDIAFNRAYQNESDSTDQYLLSGRRVSNFIIHRVEGNDFTIRHPSRGVMEASTDSKGNLTFLDAKATTRKLKVYRAEELDFNGLVNRFKAIDAKGSPFGTLSPAIEDSFSFKNTEFKVSYGSPQKRGRDIFGGIVSYGERWRTGANRATHFSTSKDLEINGKTVPAGEYTLFSIPEENGGILIINKQTGQNGRSYNQDRDLMRVAMTRKVASEFYEGFTVRVTETQLGGKIQLLWDKTSYEVNFTILK